MNYGSMTVARNMCKIFSLIPSRKPATREKWEKLCIIFNFWIKKLTQTPILVNYQLLNSFLGYNFRFCQSKSSLSQFSLVTGFFQGSRDTILHIFRVFLAYTFLGKETFLISRSAVENIGIISMHDIQIISQIQIDISLKCMKSLAFCRKSCKTMYYGYSVTKFLLKVLIAFAEFDGQDWL